MQANRSLSTLFLLCFSVPLLSQEQVSEMSLLQQHKARSKVTQEQLNAVAALSLQSGGKISVTWNEENGTPTFFTGALPSERALGKSAALQEQVVFRFLEQHKIIFKLTAPREELQLFQAEYDELEMSHLKFNQVYRGIPVWGSQLMVHFNKEGAIQTINGRYHPSFDIPIMPSISKEQAIGIAQSQVTQASDNPQAELYIYLKDGLFVLAWRVKLPSFEYPNMDVLVDARDGSILRKDDGIRHMQQMRPHDRKGPASVERVTFTLDPARTQVISLPAPEPKPSGSGHPSQTHGLSDWQVLLSDGFEQKFPDTVWLRKSTGSATVYWDTTSFKARSGSKSLYCARSGPSGRDPYTFTTYPNTMNTMIRFGPFDLRDATDAVLQYSHWTVTELAFDFFWVLVGTDTVNFTGLRYSGNWTTASSGADANGWQTDQLNLTVSGLGDLRGSPKVWIAFLFTSDFISVGSYRGTFIDDIELRKELLTGGTVATGTGIGLNGRARPLNTARFGSSYYLIDASRAMFVSPIGQEKGVISTWDAQSDSTGNTYGSIIRVRDPNNDNNFNDNEQLKAAVDAHDYTGIVYNYYRTIHSRNSWDGKGTTLRSFVHYRNKYNNAFWNGQFMTYGDGDGVLFSNLAGAVDVIGHEITHGVIESSANLLYEGQSGALNESYADVFGTFIEFYARGGSGNWLVGEDIFTPATAGDALRNMQDPHLSYNWQPAHMTEYVDLLNSPAHDIGGVHINSGIPNRVCYLIALTIGAQKTERIYYRTLTRYLTNASQFIDARNGTLQAAADLYGNQSIEYRAVESGFVALGLTPDIARELIYDNGIPTKIEAWLSSGAIVAVRMSLPVTPVRIVKVEYYIFGTASGTRRFTVRILKDSSGTPGTDLMTPISVTPSGDGWYTVTLSNYIASYYTVAKGDFYVGIQYDGVNRPYIAYTDGSNGRAWGRSNSSVALTQRLQTYFIRAVVSPVVEAPTPNFTATPTGGGKPLTVTFTNQSLGIILSYFWNFGDGYTSTQRNPVHTYTTDGSYSVSLMVIGPGGTDQQTKATYITVGGPTALEESQMGRIPKTFALFQNYPNPFNPSTTIRFDVPKLSHVSLKVYNMLGQEIETLIEGERAAGEYSVKWKSNNVPSGVYFYRLQARGNSFNLGNSFIETKKLLLLR